MVPRLAAETANGAVADHGRLGLKCSLPALDAAGRHGSVSLVCLRLGDAVAFGRGLNVGTVAEIASRLCDEAKPGQILISPRVLMKVENAVKVEPVGEFELKGIRRPLAAYNVVAALASKI